MKRDSRILTQQTDTKRGPQGPNTRNESQHVEFPAIDTSAEKPGDSVSPT